MVAPRWREAAGKGGNQEEAGLGRHGDHTGSSRAGDDQTSSLDVVVTVLESQFPLDLSSGCISLLRLCGRGNCVFLSGFLPLSTE